MDVLLTCPPVADRGVASVSRRNNSEVTWLSECLGKKKIGGSSVVQETAKQDTCAPQRRELFDYVSSMIRKGMMRYKSRLSVCSSGKRRHALIWVLISIRIFSLLIIPRISDK